MTLPGKNQDETLKARVEEIITVGKDMRIIRLKPAAPFNYSAGQYIHISFGGMHARPYSIAAAPGGETIEIHIKRGKGEASTYVLDTLQEGHEVEFSGPDGSTIFNETIHGPVMALAGGMGITPLKAIVDEAIAQGFAHPFILYWGTQEDNEKYLSGHFSALAADHENFAFVPVSGKPITSVLKDVQEDLSDWHIYISGPPAMISAVIPLLLDKGAQRANIKYDRHPEAGNLKL